MNKVKKVLQDSASWVVLVLLVVLFSVLSPRFRTVGNFITILRQVSVNGIVAVGLTVILISGGIDLSTGAQCAFSGMLCALLNGTAIAQTNMPPLIATLGTMNIAKGVAFLINDGKTVYGLPQAATVVGQASLGQIPVCVLLLVVVLIVGHFILNKTTYGRLIFAVGANKEAARLSGIPVKLITTSAYVVGSLFIGLGGVVLMSRLNSGLPSAGSDIYIEVLAGCIIGGVSAKGGEGRVFKMIGGVLVMGVISNGMNVAGLSEYWQYVAKGAILIVSVGVDAYRTTIALNKKSHTIRSSAANAAAAKH